MTLAKTKRPAPKSRASRPSPGASASSANLDLVMQLMAIPGKSGDEAVVASFIRQKLQAAGASPAAIATDEAHLRTIIEGNTGNLIFKLPGTMHAPRRMLSAHMDTVPICVGCQPERNGDYVRSANPATGLGGDDRAGAATILSAALAILKEGMPHPPLTFCWFIQEEVGLQGARHLEKSLLGKPAMCFNWDGGAPEKVTIGATGGYRMDITVEGVASHAGVAPERGVSAIAIAACAIADIHRGGWHGLVEKGKQRGTSNVGVIAGGDATNVVTDRVTIRAEARSHSPKFRERIIREIEKSFEKAAKEVKSWEGKRGRVSIDGRLDYEAFRLDPGSECVRLAEQAVSAAGRTPQRAISNGGLDANWLNAHGIPTVTLGCGQMNVHMTSEMLDISGYEDACRIALELATGG